MSKPSIIGPSRATDIELLQSLAYGYRLPISSLRIMRLRRKVDRYKTRISPHGSARGGLTDPHIIVGVKLEGGTTGLQDLRSFITAPRPRHKELYVSTSGFTKEARYKAHRANNQVSLIDCDELVNPIIHFYDSFDAEAGSLLPLRKIY